MHFSATAKRGLAIACRTSVGVSVCDVGGFIVITQVGNCTDHQPNTFALCSQKAIYLLPGGHGEIWGETRGGVGKSGILDNKSGNISETRKDGGKVTMDGLQIACF